MKEKAFLILTVFTALIFNPAGQNIFELPKSQWLISLTAIAGIVFALKIIFEDKMTILSNKYINLILLAWTGSLLISTIFSVAPNLSFWGNYNRSEGLIAQLSYLIFFFIFLQLFTQEKLRTFFTTTLLAISAPIALYAILEQFGISFAAQSTIQLNEFAGRSFASFGHPNALGQFLLFPIFASLTLFPSKDKKLKILSITLFILFTSALFLTQNRASLLALLASLTLLLILKANLKPTHKIALSALGATLLSAFIYFIAPTTRSLLTRLHLWQDSLHLALQKPLTGHGLETFQITHPSVASTELLALESFYNIPDRPHNQFLDILTQQGLLGLSIFLIIIISTFILIRPQLKKTQTAIWFTALIATLITNFFGFATSINNVLFVAFLALTINQVPKALTPKQLPRSPLTIFTSGIVMAACILFFFNAPQPLRADIKFHQGITQQDVKLIEEATLLNPNQSEIFYKLGSIITRGAQSTDGQPPLPALNYAQGFIQQGGRFSSANDFRYHFYLGLNYSLSQKFQEANESFQVANQLAPTNPAVLKEWGISRFNLGDYEQSISILEELLEIAPPYWQWKNELDSRTELERWYFMQFFRTNADFWQIFSYLSEAHNKKGDPEAAQFYSQFK